MMKGDHWSSLRYVGLLRLADKSACRRFLNMIRHDTKVKASQLKRCSSAYSYCYEVRMSVEEGQTPVGKDPRVGVENEKLSISRFPLRHNPVQVFCI